MRICKATLESVSPYSQSRPYETEKLNKESASDYEERTWRDRMNVLASGEVFIPPMGMKICLSDAAKFLSVRIPGRGQSTFTKHFESGVLVTEPIRLGIMRDQVESERLFVPSDGVRGGGSRVWKRFPLIREWKAVATFVVLDDIITEAIFEQHLAEAGQFIGVGRFRPRNNGFYGRFRTVETKWQGVDEEEAAA